MATIKPRPLCSVCKCDTSTSKGDGYKLPDFYSHIITITCGKCWAKEINEEIGKALAHNPQSPETLNEVASHKPEIEE